MAGAELVEYPHPLDYAVGLRYALTRKKLDTVFELTSDSFYVEELVRFDELGLNTEKGNYAVLRITKKSTEMFSVLNLLAKLLGVPLSNIHVFGIKDKDATTVSHVFTKAIFVNPGDFPLIKKNFTIELLGYTRIKPRRDHFIGNRFKVIIREARQNSVEIVREIVRTVLEVGLPSYYGYQRFGYRRYNSHILGKYLLLGREDLFANHLIHSVYPLENPEVIMKRLERELSTLLYEQEYAKATLHNGQKTILRKTRGIYLSAYASYLYNLLINELIEKLGLSSLDGKYLPLPGCTESYEYYRFIAGKEGLNATLLRSLPCFKRSALFRVRDTLAEARQCGLVVEFTLDPGMFATVVLRELFKENLMLPA